MNIAQINSLIRSALKMAGPLLSAHGYAAASSLCGNEQYIGYFLTFIGLLWSHFTHGDDSSPASKPPGASYNALLLTFATAGLIFTSGCGTPQAKVYQAEGVTINSVDTAMKVWAEQVRAGKATQAQIDTVHKAYQAYYDAQQVAKAALEKWIASGTPADCDANSTAATAVTNAVNAIIDLVQQYTK